MLRPKTGAELGILEVNNRRNEIRFRRESDDQFTGTRKMVFKKH